VKIYQTGLGIEITPIQAAREIGGDDLFAVVWCVLILVLV
jgi:hypothetical protein